MLVGNIKKRHTGTMKVILRWLLPLTAVVVFVLPIWIFFDARGGLGFVNGLDFQNASLALFPVVGLTAFTLLWMQLMVGSLMPWLKKLFRGIERFHRTQGVFVFLFALGHPGFLVVGIGIQAYLSRSFVSSTLVPYLLLGQIAIILLSLSVLAALMRKVAWVKRWWRLIHLLNYVTFIFVWLHSWNLGSDIRGSVLEYIWIAYGLTFVFALTMRLLGKSWPLSLRTLLPSVVTDPAVPNASPAQPTPNGGMVEVAKLSDLEEGKPFCGLANGKKLALFRFGDHVYAMDNRCNHEDASLCGGILEGATIECPLHFSRFDVRTGALIDGPATQPQHTYPVEVHGQSVFVRL